MNKIVFATNNKHKLEKIFLKQPIHWKVMPCRKLSMSSKNTVMIALPMILALRCKPSEENLASTVPVMRLSMETIPSVTIPKPI